MQWHSDTLTVRTRGKGLYPITDAVSALLHGWQVSAGFCILFVQHTSASLVINESYDPSARADMAEFLERLVPEGQRWFTHTLEGPDDSTSHLRALLLPTSLHIPVDNGQFSLGTWQGIYLVEHRRAPHSRRVLVRAGDVW